MKFRLGILFILIIFLFHPIPSTHAQKVKGKGQHTAQNSQDSLKTVRQHILDSTHAAQKAYLDSVKGARQRMLDSSNLSRQRILDSTKTARQHITDSIKVIQKYRSGKHYKDSVAAVRKAHADSLKAARQHVLDSTKAARQHITDSVVAVRKAHLDSMRVVQKKRSDSLAVIRKYKASKRYRDSVSIARTERLDSIRDARKAYNDSMLKIREHIRDSTNAVRKRVMDSTTAVRNKYLDSLKTIRKERADSLAKIKKEREKLQKSRENLKKQKMQLALDLKIKQKREKWSNANMLKKKWSVPRKIEQNTFSRYNYYYNANRKMDEALANMQRAHKENYDSLIGLYPFDPNKDSTLLSSDMDSIIHKVSVGIQIHDPRTKWEDDMYLLLGEAYYYKGGYENAATSFRYIIAMDEQRKKQELAKKGYNTHTSSGKQPSIVENDKKSMLDFLKHKAVHNESILWLSRTYTEAGQIENAESIISLLDSDPNLPDNMKGRVALERAFTYLADGNKRSASEQLTIAVKDNNVPDWLRMRSAFLNGQLLQEQGNYDTAVLSFKRVLDFNPKIDMDFYARKYMAYNTMYAGGKVDDMISSFKRLLTDGKYIPYYDQIYYILGTLAANVHNTDDAISYFNKSIHTLHASKKQKAISFATMGNVYYATGDYVNAKNAYDSAAHLSSNDPNDTLMTVAVKRSNALGSVTGPIKTIHDQDSLLHLASLDEREQRAVVRRYIRELERRREDSIYRAQNAGLNAATETEQNGGNTLNAANWYFTNPTSMQQGYNEFKRIWGNRPLTDNWRRISAIGFNMAGTQGSQQNEVTDSTSQQGGLQLDENGLPTEASLLALIPNTPEQKDKSHKLLQRAYIDLSNAYVRELEDYKHATQTLDTLDTRFPGHDFKPEDYYLRYLMALRQGQYEIAKTYNAKLLQEYPDSKYADLVRPKEDSSTALLNTSDAEANFYDETYQLLTQHQYTDVLLRSKEALKKYDDTVFAQRFHIMEAIALAGSGNYKSADTLLTAFMRTQGNDSLRLWADEVVKFMRNYPSGPPQVIPGPSTARQWPYYDYTHQYGYTDESGSGSTSDTVYSVNYNKNANKAIPYSTETSNLPALINYSYQPQEPHYFAIAIPGLEARVAGLRDSIKAIDSAEYADSHLSVLIDLFSPQQAVLLVSGFKSGEEAGIYMAKVMADTSVFSAYKPGEYNVFTISENNYKKLFFEHNLQAYLSFYSMYYRQ